MPPMADYCRHFQSRALGQSERHELRPKDVYFMLEISEASGEKIVSRALCIGNATKSPRGYQWDLPELGVRWCGMGGRLR